MILPTCGRGRRRKRRDDPTCLPLAYALWKTLAGWMQRSRLGDAPRTVLEEFAKLKSVDVVLRTQDRPTGCQRAIRLRCVTEPDAAQKTLLGRLASRCRAASHHWKTSLHHDKPDAPNVV